VAVKFQSKLTLVFQDQRFTKRRDKMIGQCFREAIRQWLRAVLVGVAGDFPVWTGEAMSSLKPLARYLRVKTKRITPVKRRKDGRPVPDRRTEGERKQRFRMRDDKSHAGSFLYSFFWRSDVLHFFINEYFSTQIKHTPWGVVAQGDVAFKMSLVSCLKGKFNPGPGEIRLKSG
jgi:hypothetical protein